MNIVKIFTLLFVVFALSRAVFRFKDKSIKSTELILWIMVWGGTLTFVFHPSISDKLAKKLGVAQGTDIAFFGSILVLFYLIFRLYVKIDRVDKDITTLSINISKQIHKNFQEKK